MGCTRVVQNYRKYKTKEEAKEAFRAEKEAGRVKKL
jgi:hypothetical protein